MRDAEFRAAYERSAAETEQTDQVIRALDQLRVDLGISKAELARRINRNASSIRRLFTASSARPELPLIAAIADALGAQVRVVRKPPAGAQNGAEPQPGTSTRRMAAGKPAARGRASASRRKAPA